VIAGCLLDELSEAFRSSHSGTPCRDSVEELLAGTGTVLRRLLTTAPKRRGF